MSGPVNAANYLRKAERALDEARMLLREKATEGACNRAYYAMHDAALLAEDYETAQSVIKTHHGLIAEFGRRTMTAVPAWHRDDLLEPARRLSSSCRVGA